ncbi:MAG: hypothetical protein IH892_22115 [Planctomycetes bacterium]|nr:hypothetical protein [Planctomycetota bacterium]
MDQLRQYTIPEATGCGDPLAGQSRVLWDAVDALAANVGSARYIVGRRRTSSDNVNPGEVQITLKKESSVLHQISGGIVKGGQWGNLMTLISQLVDQGYTIRSRNIIIFGALGDVRPAAPGTYSADYGPLGGIDFALR